MDVSDQDFTDKNLTGACQKSLPQHAARLAVSQDRRGDDTRHSNLEPGKLRTAKPGKRHMVGE